MTTTRKKLPSHRKGSGNIFADLGLPNAEEHQLKAALVVQVKRLMAERGMRQVVASKLVKMKQPDLSKVLRGDFRLVSVEKLMRMLTAFDQDIEITVRPQRKRGEAGRISFVSIDCIRHHSLRRGVSSYVSWLVCQDITRRLS